MSLSCEFMILEMSTTLSRDYGPNDCLFLDTTLSQATYRVECVVCSVEFQYIAFSVKFAAFCVRWAVSCHPTVTLRKYPLSRKCGKAAVYIYTGLEVMVELWWIYVVCSTLRVLQLALFIEVKFSDPDSNVQQSVDGEQCHVILP